MPRSNSKKPIRSFCDLEVYQKTLECFVIITNSILPEVDQSKFNFIEGISNCALTIPLRVAESHSMRFSDFNKAIYTLESSMTGCNKMVVYLDLLKGLQDTLDIELLEDLSMRYIVLRMKMLRLLKSWQKYKNEYVGK